MLQTYFWREINDLKRNHLISLLLCEVEDQPVSCFTCSSLTIDSSTDMNLWLHFRGSQQLNFETPVLCLSDSSVFMEFFSCWFLCTEHQKSELLVLLLWFNKTPGFELDQVWILGSISNLNMSPTCFQKGVSLRGTCQITLDWSLTSLLQYYSYNLTPLHTVCPRVKQTKLCADIQYSITLKTQVFYM